MNDFNKLSAVPEVVEEVVEVVVEEVAVAHQQHPLHLSNPFQ
jgi:hypothetical protein